MAAHDNTSLGAALCRLSLHAAAADAPAGPASSPGAASSAAPASSAGAAASAELVFINARGSKVAVSRETLAKIPFLDTLFSGRLPSQQDDEGNFELDLDPLVLSAIFRFVASGHGQHLLSALPSGVSDAGTIFETLDFLCVDLAASLDDICERLRGDSIYWRGGQDKARDAAAELLLGLSTGAFDTSDHSVIQRLFQRVLFVVSHPRTFGRRIRRWAHQMGLQHIPGLSRRQLQVLQEWREKGDTFDAWRDSSTSSSDSDD